MLSPIYIILRIQRLEGRVDLDEVAHDEPPPQHLHCLQIQLFLSLVLKELIKSKESTALFWKLFDHPSYKYLYFTMNKILFRPSTCNFLSLALCLFSALFVFFFRTVSARSLG